jgi:hypothetical protein
MTSIGNHASGSAHGASGLSFRGVGPGCEGTLGDRRAALWQVPAGRGKDPFTDWESSEGLATWDGAPAPALVAKRLLEDIVHPEVSPCYARGLNNATHWSFGLASGVGHGLLVGSRQSKVWWGLSFGAAVCSVDPPSPRARCLPAELGLRLPGACQRSPRAFRLRNRHRVDFPVLDHRQGTRDDCTARRKHIAWKGA